MARSRRTLKLIAAFEAVGHTNVTVRWEPVGGALEMCGHTGGYFFESDQKRGVWPIGTSLAEAMHNVPTYAVRRPEIDADNRFASYNRGWSHGAAMKAMAPEFTEHKDVGIVAAYERGYTAGREARNIAAQDASQIYGHTPSILRLADGAPC